VIVRIMGEGQFEIDDEVAKGLNDLDEQAEQALETGDADRFGELLHRMAEAVRTNGCPTRTCRRPRRSCPRRT